MNLKNSENRMINMTKKEIEAVKQESISMIKQTLQDLLHDKYTNKTTYGDKILLYVNDLKIAYTLNQIKDIETNFNEDCSAFKKDMRKIYHIEIIFMKKYPKGF